MKNIAVQLLTLATVNAAGYDYQQDGNDWPELKIEGNLCGSTNQSPIDLPSESDDIYLASKDNFQKWYDNKFGLSVKWNGHTSQVDFDTDLTDEEDSNTFQSQYSVDVNKAPSTFDGV